MMSVSGKLQYWFAFRNTRGENKGPSVGRYTVDVDSFNLSLQQVFKDEVTIRKNYSFYHSFLHVLHLRQLSLFF